MSEKKLREKLKSNWGYFFQRIENTASEGTPDLLICIEQPIYVELKFLSKPFIKTKLKFRISQKKWFLNYPSVAFVLFQINKYYYIFDKQIFNQMDDNFFITFEKFEKFAIIKTCEIGRVVEFLSQCSFNYK